MISDFSVRVLPKNKNATVIFLLLLSFSMILFLYSSTLESYKGIVGLVSLAFIVGAVYVFTRHVIAEYYYDLIGGDEPMLVVRQAFGKRSTTMCRVSLADIERVEACRLDGAEVHKTPEGYRKYKYTLTVGDTDGVRIYVSSPFEKSEIVLEASAEFANVLCEYSKEAKENKSSYYEE